MKKLYSLVAMVMFAVAYYAQTTATITITNASIGGSAVLGTSSYNGGAERTWTTNGIDFGGKAITGNNNGTPAGFAANSVIQAQANNGVIYNTTALPGRIVSITINSGGTAQVSSFYGGSTGRLVNNVAADYAVTGGTQVGTASSTGWTSTDFTGTNYTFFAIKRGANASYITSIDIVYETSSLSVSDINSAKFSLVKNTLVEDAVFFGAKADVKVYNMNAQVVKSAAVSETKNLDVADLQPGMYIVTGTVNGEAVSQKILKK